MIHAYNKEYVSDAMENLGEAFDYAVHAQNLNLNRFSSLFVNASASKSIENGNPKYISGMSGTELALTVLSQNGIEPKPVQSLLLIMKNLLNTGAAGSWRITSGIQAKALRQS